MKQKKQQKNSTKKGAAGSASQLKFLSEDESLALTKSMRHLVLGYARHWEKHQTVKNLRPFYQHRLMGTLKILAQIKGVSVQELTDDLFASHHLEAMRLKITKDWNIGDIKLTIEPDKFFATGEYKSHRDPMGVWGYKWRAIVCERRGTKSTIRWRSEWVGNVSWEKREELLSEAKERAREMMERHEAESQG